MPTFGERLLAQTAARENAKRALEDGKLAAERRKEDRERAQLRRMLVEALEDLKDAVEDNREFKDHKIKNHYSMPVRYNHRMSADVYFWEPAHPYHDEFKAMVAKARLDGLEYVFTHDHDGMGMESWYVISFKPLDVYMDETLGHGHGL